MSSNKKSSKNNKNQEIIEEEEEKEKMEIENEEEENEERDEEGMEDQEEEDKEQEENEGEEENEEEENKKEEKENDDLEDRIANIGDASLKIQNIVSILSDFKTKREEGKSRSTYMQELKNLCKSYYEYNDDICDLIFNLFPPNEAIEFMEASDSQKVLTIRTNSLKTKRRELAKNLISRGVNLDPLAEWSKVGLKIYSSSVPIGATPEYLSGQYMLQSASSFLPVLAMDPHPGDKILDMCASPGGKTTYIGQLMKNEGLLVANDFKKERIKSLFFNIHRMGIKNSIITNYDGREFAKLYNKFDRVLLDAPCSGLGVISKDKSVKMNRTYKEILNNSRLQKELILAAIDSCNAKGKGDGIIVYSTCSISVEENEWVIDYALKHRYVKCIETGIEIGEPGLVKFREKHFHPTVSNTRRIYPHIHNIDGFFIAKLKKYNDGPKIKGEIQKKEKEKKNKNRNKKKEKKNLNEENENENEKEVEEEEDENENDNNNIDVDEYENNLEENSEPEDIQDQIKRGKLKNYNIGDDKNKKNKKKKKNKNKEEDEEDDGIFSGEEYEKDEEDIEKEAKKQKIKKDKMKENKNKDEKNLKKNKKQKQKEIEEVKNKSKEKEKKQNKKEKTLEKNNQEKKEEKTKEEKSNKKVSKIMDISEEKEENNNKDNIKSSKKEKKKEKKVILEKEDEKDEDENKEDEDAKKEIEKSNKKKKKKERKESEEKEEKLISKKRKASDSEIKDQDNDNKDKNKDKSGKKKKKK